MLATSTTDDALRHGEAVGLGLLAAARIGAALLPDAEPGLPRRVARLLTRLGLPADLDAALAAHPGALDRIAVDKKRSGTGSRPGLVSYVTLAAPGRTPVLLVEPAQIVALALARPRSAPIATAPEATS